MLTETKEADKAVFVLKEADPEAVKYMIYYFYHSDYKTNRDWPRIKAAVPNKKRTWTSMSKPEPDSTTEKPSNLSLHVRVYATAQFFLVDNLKKLALKHFIRLAGFYWNTSEFFKAVDDVFALYADKPMQDAVLGILIEHPNVLLEDYADEVVIKHDLSYEILQKLLRSKPFDEGDVSSISV